MDIEDRTAFMHLLEDLSKRREKINKLKTALTEIKQIASREAETSRYNGSFTWKQILQKISECEVE